MPGPTSSLCESSRLGPELLCHTQQPRRRAGRPWSKWWSQDVPKCPKKGISWDQLRLGIVQGTSQTPPPHPPPYVGWVLQLQQQLLQQWHAVELQIPPLAGQTLRSSPAQQESCRVDRCADPVESNHVKSILGTGAFFACTLSYLDMVCFPGRNVQAQNPANARSSVVCHSRIYGNLVVQGPFSFRLAFHKITLIALIQSRSMQPP